MAKITRKPIASHSHNGNGKTYYFMKESDIKQAKNMSYLYGLEGKSIKNLSAVAKVFFENQNDAKDNEIAENKVFDIITENNNNKMAIVSKVSEEIKIERLKRKRAEKRIIELEKMIEKAIS